MKPGTRLQTRTTAFCAALVLAATLCACGGQQAGREEAPAASPQPTASPAADAKQEAPALLQPNASPQPPAAPAPTLAYAPPQASEVRAALERIYKGAVTFDERGGRTAVGDFNGDGSEDLLVEVRPARARVAELNDELANWIVAEPRKVQPPDPRNFDPHQGVQKLAPAPSRPRVGDGDTLLVVIHGYKESGWRNPEANQTYLLKDAAGADWKTEPRAEAQAEVQKRLRLLGDVVREKLGDQSGFLYWTGASYGWFH
jgi:hypothetical protein